MGDESTWEGDNTSQDTAWPPRTKTPQTRLRRQTNKTNQRINGSNQQPPDPFCNYKIKKVTSSEVVTPPDRPYHKEPQIQTNFQQRQHKKSEKAKSEKRKSEKRKAKSKKRTKKTKGTRAVQRQFRSKQLMLNQGGGDGLRAWIWLKNEWSPLPLRPKKISKLGHFA
jgi:septum formation inhibitor MinC